MPPKKGRGCVVLLSIAMSILALLVIVVIVAVGLFATSDAGKGTFKALSDGTKVATKGLKAPGTPELRALGCDQAMVVEMKDFAVVMSDLDAGDMSSVPNDLLVTCQGKAFSDPPTCDEVAAAYVSAVGTPASNFYVTVTRQGDGKPTCEQRYDPRGLAIGSTAKRKPGHE